VNKPASNDNVEIPSERSSDFNMNKWETDMNLRLLTDDELHDSSQTAAASEREETLKLLKHLNEVERRHLFSKFECSSLHAYCVKYLKMSDPQAGRRVAAARLLSDLPILEKKVATGFMTLTSVCQMSSFIKNEARAGNHLNQLEKLELLSRVDSQSTKKIEQILLSHASHPDLHFRESVKQKTETITEIKIMVGQDFMADLERLKEIWSHALP
jgi:hypothetical protein